jgi:hypothetical protein
LSEPLKLRLRIRSPLAQEITMALFDPVSITREIEATPFAYARNVVIAYPHFEDWKKLYKPQPLRMPDARGIYRNVDAFESRYQDMKRDHEKNVLKQLRRIQGWPAGRAVFAELRAWLAFSVYILPFDFLPIGDWRFDKSGLLVGAITEPITLPQSAAERARGKTPRGTQVCARGACWAAPDSPAGKSADVFYTARRFPDQDTDGALLHELVHAARLISGAQRTVPMGGGYGNTEEFLANTIEMIYRSEKRLPIYDYDHIPFDAASFLDPKTMASVVLTDLRVAQSSLFDALAHVDAPFNPIKQLDDQRRKLQGG